MTCQRQYTAAAIAELQQIARDTPRQTRALQFQLVTMRWITPVLVRFEINDKALIDLELLPQFGELPDAVKNRFVNEMRAYVEKLAQEAGRDHDNSGTNPRATGN